MTATYTPGGSSDRDTVRLLTGDTDMDNALLQNEEIDRFLAIEDNYWLAAALAGEAIMAKWGGQSGGLSRKRVDDLELQWGDKSGLQDKIDYWRARGNREESSASPHFRVMGSV